MELPNFGDILLFDNYAQLGAFEKELLILHVDSNFDTFIST